MLAEEAEWRGQKKNVGKFKIYKFYINGHGGADGSGMKGAVSIRYWETALFARIYWIS